MKKKMMMTIWRLNFAQVGPNLKTPLYPIWVVCSESHYTVLFCSDKSLLQSNAPKVFTLQFYDSLARQKEEIKLLVGASSPLLTIWM